MVPMKFYLIRNFTLCQFTLNVATISGPFVGDRMQCWVLGHVVIMWELCVGEL